VGTQRETGLVPLVAAIIPIGDMLVILAAKGSAKSAFGIHGLTAAIMALAAIPMMTGAH
jgi:KaiC/GvpD/RAD55 family RecA-like ATPase